MSAIQTYFQDFLTNIRLPDSLKKALISAHTELREQLKSDDLTKDLLVESFYRVAMLGQLVLNQHQEKRWM